MITLRVRAPSGVVTLELPSTATLAALRGALLDKTGVAVDRQELLAGFPPAAIRPDDESRSLAALGVGSGVLILREATGTLAPAPSLPPPSPALPVVPPPPPPPPARPNPPPAASPADPGAMVRRVVASDNSCLFNAVAYVMSGGRAPDGGALALRRIVAAAIAADSETYTEGYLGKPPAEYMDWICRPTSWGGGIELAVLSAHFGREIAAYDIATTRRDCYGSGAGHAERSLLLYDGLHYDALVQNGEGESGPEFCDVTVFPTTGPESEAAESGAAALVAAQHAARAFTDTATFTLRCLVCQQGVVGQKEAVEHAKQTAHARFGEYSR